MSFVEGYNLSDLYAQMRDGRTGKEKIVLERRLGDKVCRQMQSLRENFVRDHCAMVLFSVGYNPKGANFG
jgi:hypothetical protein